MSNPAGVVPLQNCHVESADSRNAPTDWVFRVTLAENERLGEVKRKEYFLAATDSDDLGKWIGKPRGDLKRTSLILFSLFTDCFVLGCRAKKLCPGTNAPWVVERRLVKYGTVCRFSSTLSAINQAKLVDCPSTNILPSKVGKEAVKQTSTPLG